MIYRIVAETHDLAWSADGVTSYMVSDGLRGAFTAGVTEGFGEVPSPRLSNPRARFYFTEAGWRRFGDQILAAARSQGRAVRVIRRKNPPRSQVVYQDAYQVAILPPGTRPSDT